MKISKTKTDIVEELFEDGGLGDTVLLLNLINDNKYINSSWSVNVSNNLKEQLKTQFFDHFFLFSDKKNHLNTSTINKKGWRHPKSILTSFGVLAAPKTGQNTQHALLTLIF